MKTKVSNVRVSLTDLANDVYQYGQYLKDNFTRAQLASDDIDGLEGGEMRLQVKDSGWQTHHGDNQFDQDHRGYWGAAFVPYGCTRKEAKSIARDLINEAQDSAAMDSAE